MAQPTPRTGQAHFTLWSTLLLVSLPFGSMPGQAQSAPVILNTSGTLAPAVDELHRTLAELKINKWHAPDAVRQDAQSNADSLARDLSDTLPGLLSAADAAPQSVPAAFAAYRNIEAAYDVLLRVSGTADLAAPDREAQDLTHTLATLEAARKALGENILTASRTEEGTLTELRAQIASAAQRTAAPAQPANSRVVTDGPTPARKSKPKPKATPPATAPAPQ